SMSEEYILLVIPYNGHKSWDIKGFLNLISEKDTLEKVTSGTIINNNLNLHFPEDNPEYNTVRKTLSGIIEQFSKIDENLKDYHFFTAEIQDRETLKEDLSLIKKTYPELLYKCYNIISPETE
ncbi:MAG: hypothetical protein KAJ56_04180, partial [Candidatus Aenigmarchaeota archaeon]|nr:hypothetical protein [Candidatus Aenigmarchaeota archaeon]MCK5290123.1 hypothetical protein [Candidatus Aenigmarchaeota archaeon]